MPVKLRDIEKALRKLGFNKIRQKGSHTRWKHPDGRRITLPVHGTAEIGGWLYHEILRQIMISEDDLRRLIK